MNIEIGAEAALFPEKEYIKGIFVAVQILNLYICVPVKLANQRRYLSTLVNTTVNSRHQKSWVDDIRTQLTWS
jgi:hypothetical protein